MKTVSIFLFAALILSQFSISSSMASFDIDAIARFRTQHRKAFINKNLSEPTYQDKVEGLLGTAVPIEKNLQNIQTKGLMKAELTKAPWSDYYWPYFSGIIGNRYADASFPEDTWNEAYDYVRTKPASTYVTGGKVNLLSPAEKYDLWVGGSALTPHMWTTVNNYATATGDVERWVGICHGWAPAAYMLPKPIKAVTVLAADGVTKITFYPSDIRALASYLWAEAAPRSRFVGGRCNDKDPAAEPGSGRTTDEDCFNNNPATWHLSVVNSIGVQNKSFVMDATYDYEVWNQPVFSYSYTFFNPKLKQPVGQLKDGLVRVSEFTTDPFRKFRSPKAKYIIGIDMTAAYVVENTPSQRADETGLMESFRTVFYTYDLELDESYNIVGGEWHENTHPDFLWTPVENGRAATSFDNGLSKLNLKTAAGLPEKVRSNAAEASKYGYPLATLVESLIEAAQ